MDLPILIGWIFPACSLRVSVMGVLPRRFAVAVRETFTSASDSCFSASSSETTFRIAVSRSGTVAMSNVRSSLASKKTFHKNFVLKVNNNSAARKCVYVVAINKRCPKARRDHRLCFRTAIIYKKCVDLQVSTAVICGCTLCATLRYSGLLGGEIKCCSSAFLYVSTSEELTVRLPL